MKEKFLIPTIDNVEVSYFCGNSLGLQPKNVRKELDIFLNDWANYGVEGHFTGENNWYSYHNQCVPMLSNLVGAVENEVACMNSLTVNLHLLLQSFYQPKKEKNKILVDYPLFPSDKFALESHIHTRGLQPEGVLIYIKPQKFQDYISTDEILEAIHINKMELSLVLLSGVNFYTGQFFDIQKISQSVHKTDAHFGLDLAHAIGNVPLELNNWNVDFATWCSYKYLNSGPGGVSGIYVHQKHHHPKISRFEGWWGHNDKTRFGIDIPFDPMPGANAWQLSNAPISQMVMHKASLKIFDEIGMKELRNDSIILTQYLEKGINKILDIQPALGIKIITPSNTNERGCQLSLKVQKFGKELVDFLKSNKIIVDWREPNVLRVAPVPLYNTTSDIDLFLEKMETFVRYKTKIN
ncbi:MAG: kynureninase [Bacteroidota bacterium]|nr:kynureninase [Bacteroidota bacterium]